MTKFERDKLIYECHKNGMSQTEIGKIYGLSQSTISEIVIAIRNGFTGDKIETRGSKSRLNDEEKTKLKQILTCSPTDYGYFMWNKWSIKALISKEFGVDYHENYIWEIMKCIRFSSQLPIKKDYRKDEKKVEIFKTQKAEDIKKKAEEENRLLVFQDESAVRILPCVTKSYAPIGQTPELICDVKNKDFVSISGSISSSGDFYFEVREQEGFKQNGLINFLDNSWANFRENLLMVWDNAPSHRSKTIKEYLAKQCQENPRIWLENIPPYSPELNPIEQLWGCLKRRLANQFVKTTKELKKIVTKALEEIKNDKKLIKSFFRHKELNCYRFFT